MKNIAIFTSIFLGVVALTCLYHISQKEVRFDPNKGPEQLQELRAGR